MSLNDLIKKGNQCLENREKIPGAPLWHMGKVAVFESKRSFDLLQNTIDYLSCKGKLKKSFTDDEKEFMKELFEAMWWGGNYLRYHVAAKLANHYVNGEGISLRINPGVYKKSIIVSDTIAALKGYIKEKSANNKSIVSIKTSNPDFLRSDHALSLKRGQRSPRRQGYILRNGALTTEQFNLSLKNTDNRFYLQVNTTKEGSNVFMSRWSIISIYDFEPFEKNHITDIHLTKEFVLKLPDGLSRYLDEIGVAKTFKYTSTWNERWIL